MPHTDIDGSIGEKIGANIQKLRKRAGMSQKELAESIEISQQGLSYYESGRRNKFEGVVFLCRIAKKLGVSVEDLVG